jgi:hypothetical protein
MLALNCLGWTIPWGGLSYKAWPHNHLRKELIWVQTHFDSPLLLLCHNDCMTVRISLTLLCQIPAKHLPDSPSINSVGSKPSSIASGGKECDQLRYSASHPIRSIKVLPHVTAHLWCPTSSSKDLKASYLIKLDGITSITCSCVTFAQHFGVIIDYSFHSSPLSEAPSGVAMYTSTLDSKIRPSTTILS